MNNVSSIGNNNLSKIEFERFLEATGAVRVPDTRRQVFEYNGERLSFSFTAKDKSPQCRQTYEDCVGFVTKIEDTPGYFRAHIDDVASGVLSRISTNGLRAYSISVPLSEMTPFTNYAS